MARLSGLQRDVLSMYRRCLRAIAEKPEVCEQCTESWNSGNGELMSNSGVTTSFSVVCKVSLIGMLAHLATPADSLQTRIRKRSASRQEGLWYH